MLKDLVIIQLYLCNSLQNLYEHDFFLKNLYLIFKNYVRFWKTNENQQTLPYRPHLHIHFE